MLNRCLLVAALFAATPILIAQDEKKAPEGATMPSPKCKEHDALKSLTGTWDVEMKMAAMPGVPGMEKPSESKGTETAELICNGLWLKSSMQSTFQGQPFQGVWLAGYDPFQKKYISYWVSSDDQECGPSELTGSYDAKTKTWTWNGKTAHGDMRSVFKMTDADHSVETCYVTGPDGKETQCMEFTRHRAKPAAAVTPAAFKPDAQKKIAKERELLLQDVGDWTAVVKMASPDQPASTESATERVSAICDGHWLWSDFNGSMMGTPFQGHSLIGFDAKANKYIGFWIDSMSATCARTTGTYDPEKKAYTFTGNCVDPTGKPMTMKEVLTRKGDDMRIARFEFTCEGNTQNMEILYSRKAKK